MSGLYFKDYVPNYFKNLAEFFNYKHRVHSYYVYNEFDGYINISCETQSVSTNLRILYNFHKNYHQDIRDKNGFHKKDIDYNTHNFDDFVNFMCNYHKKIGRKYKLSHFKR